MTSDQESRLYLRLASLMVPDFHKHLQKRGSWTTPRSHPRRSHPPPLLSSGIFIAPPPFRLRARRRLRGSLSDGVDLVEKPHAHGEGTTTIQEVRSRSSSRPEPERGDRRGLLQTFVESAQEGLDGWKLEHEGGRRGEGERKGGTRRRLHLGLGEDDVGT